ncbi:Cdc42 effector protein 4 [Larimichthys crocea]|uniref:Uncharacterized protein n=1 Tax=Larimichthys crocea TaxID=215358 RepID=A0ACD3R637_LARCR|nr:Cdc42 effector protein 4 [Larimichthys crocea]
MSLPFLNDEDRGDIIVAKSLSPSPLKQQGEVDGRGAAAATHFLELEEQSFGELTELPENTHYYGGGMKHAESVMSFHVDLGPSMLGEILGVMEKEDDDLGYEEGKSSEGRASPPLSTHGEEEDSVVEREKDEDAEGQIEAEEEKADLQQQASIHPDSSIDLEPENGGTLHPGVHSRDSAQTLAASRQLLHVQLWLLLPWMRNQAARRMQEIQTAPPSVPRQRRRAISLLSWRTKTMKSTYEIPKAS